MSLFEVNDSITIELPSDVKFLNVKNARTQRNVVLKAVGFEIRTTHLNRFGNMELSIPVDTDKICNVKILEEKLNEQVKDKKIEFPPVSWIKYEADGSMAPERGHYNAYIELTCLFCKEGNSLYRPKFKMVCVKAIAKEDCYDLPPL